MRTGRVQARESRGAAQPGAGQGCRGSGMLLLPDHHDHDHDDDYDDYHKNLSEKDHSDDDDGHDCYIRCQLLVITNNEMSCHG